MHSSEGGGGGGGEREKNAVYTMVQTLSLGIFFYDFRGLNTDFFFFFGRGVVWFSVLGRYKIYNI